MVEPIGRAPREENPMPGEKPGYVASFKRLDGRYVRAGEENPLPTTDSSASTKLNELKTIISNQEAKTKPVKDDAVLTKLAEMDTKINGIIDGTTPANMQVTGSLAELTADAPELILNVPYTEFTPDQTVYKRVNSILNRNARQRTFIIMNELNEKLTNFGIYIQDSTIALGAVGTAQFKYNDTISHAYKQTFFFSDKEYKGLGIMGDSVQFELPMGATAPISGQVKLYLMEVL